MNKMNLLFIVLYLIYNNITAQTDKFKKFDKIYIGIEVAAHKTDNTFAIFHNGKHQYGIDYLYNTQYYRQNILESFGNEILKKIEYGIIPSYKNTINYALYFAYALNDNFRLFSNLNSFSTKSNSVVILHFEDQFSSINDKTYDSYVIATETRMYGIIGFEILAKSSKIDKLNWYFQLGIGMNNINLINHTYHVNGQNYSIMRVGQYLGNYQYNYQKTKGIGTLALISVGGEYQLNKSFNVKLGAKLFSYKNNKYADFLIYNHYGYNSSLYDNAYKFQFDYNFNIGFIFKR